MFGWLLAIGAGCSSIESCNTGVGRVRADAYCLAHPQSIDIRLTFLYITNHVTLPGSRGVFELENGMNEDLRIGSPLIGIRTGSDWVYLSHAGMDRSKVFPPGKSVFETWVPDKGGPYCVVIAIPPFPSMKTGNSDWWETCRTQWRIKEYPAIQSQAFRVSDGPPVNPKDFPVIKIPPS